MVKKLLLPLATVFLVTLSATAQCNGRNSAFQSGEKISYNVYYNWGFIWINAGIVNFTVKEQTYKGHPSYFLKSYGRTYKAYDFLFKVRDTFEVYVDTMNLIPFEFYRASNEGSTHSHHRYIFDRQNSTIYTSVSKDRGPYKNSVLPWPPCTFDVLSMVYKARNIDYNSYDTEDKIPVRMIVDGKTYDLYIRYKGKETIKTRDGREFKCLKFSPFLVEGTIFSGGEKMTVWVTDDKNRIPVMVEAKILIGSVKAIFVKAEGLRNPMEADITR